MSSLINLLPGKGKYRQEILFGLSSTQKKLSPKFLYDKRGSELFDKICKLNEYYLTRAETEILSLNAYEMSKWMGRNIVLIEPGCGSCEKVRYLLSELKNPHAYIPMDISSEHFSEHVRNLKHDFHDVRVYPIISDYTLKFSLTKSVNIIPGKRVVFFPGSTIGNLSPDDAITLLNKMGEVVGPGGGLLIGVDQKKSPRILNRAYNDKSGITAEFNLNVLDHLNREFAAGFDRSHFHHEAIYNEIEGRIEMHLVSEVSQTVQIGEELIHFDQNEYILTENSYKYSISEFVQLAQTAGFRVMRTWQDHRHLFCVYYFEKNPAYL